MVKDNIIQFPKKFTMPKTPKEDKELQKKIAEQHQQIFCQAMADEITENILIRLHSENISVTSKDFLKDYKLVSESLKSLLLRTQGLKHTLQSKVDKAVTTKGKGNSPYSITIDYDKFK